MIDMRISAYASTLNYRKKVQEVRNDNIALINNKNDQIITERMVSPDQKRMQVRKLVTDMSDLEKVLYVYQNQEAKLISHYLLDELKKLSSALIDQIARDIEKILLYK